jgi:hypothetical protein
VISSYTDHGYAIIDKEIDAGEIERSYTLTSR